MRALFFAVLTVLLWGVAPVVEKAALRQTDVLPAMCIRSFGVCGLLLLYVTVTRGFGALGGLPWQVYVLIIIGGTCASLIGQATFFKTLKSDDASLVVPFVATFPMVTTVGALLFLGESLTVRKAVGIVFALIGAYLLSSVPKAPLEARAMQPPPVQVGPSLSASDSAPQSELPGGHRP